VRIWGLRCKLDAKVVRGPSLVAATKACGEVQAYADGKIDMLRGNSSYGIDPRKAHALTIVRPALVPAKNTFSRYRSRLRAALPSRERPQGSGHEMVEAHRRSKRLRLRAFIDYDNDGWIDIFVLSGTRLDKAPISDRTTSFAIMATEPSPM
jgi:hypothetical protein